MQKPIILKDFDPVELKKLDDITKECHKLHVIPPAVLKVQLEVFDKNGNPISVYRDLSRSWVRNNYNFMTMQQLGVSIGALGATYGAGALMVRRTDGTNETTYQNNTMSSRAPMDQNTSGHFRAGAGVVTHGIVVGTGTDAESFESHTLAALIANGTGAGQMDYAAMDAPGVTWGSSKFTETVIRYINNNSGASITVNEVGLYCLLYVGVAASSTSQYYMLARDLQSPGVEVVNTAQLKVTYTIESAVYPA